MTTDDRRRGLEMMSRVYGWDVQDGPGDFFAITVDHLFAEIWSRPGLTLRDRRLLLIGMLTGRGLDDVAEIQIGAGLRNGELDPAQLREIVIFLTHYVGWPLGARLNAKAERLIAKHAAAASTGRESTPDGGHEAETNSGREAEKGAGREAGKGGGREAGKGGGREAETVPGARLERASAMRPSRGPGARPRGMAGAGPSPIRGAGQGPALAWPKAGTRDGVFGERGASGQRRHRSGQRGLLGA